MVFPRRIVPRAKDEEGKKQREREAVLGSFRAKP
jgi:hypothetical protein